MNPAGSEDHFGHDKIYSGAGDWNIKMSQMSCSFQLGDRMFIVGGSGSTYGYDNYELLFAPPQWIGKVGSQKDDSFDSFMSHKLWLIFDKFLFEPV